MREGDSDELRILAEGAIEGTLSDEQKLRLETLVLTHSTAAEFYAAYVALHAALRVSKGAPVSFPSVSTAGVAESKSRNRTASRFRMSNLGWASLFAIAASVVLITLNWGSFSKPTPVIATIAEVKGCKWDAGTLPTELGAKLTAGRLRLAEGIVRIVFSNGVDVRLESPADFELLSNMKCYVRSGQLIAKVPPLAKGFVVETPSSVITDFGTEFGVSVGNDASAFVQVFEGRVDALHRGSGETAEMHQGSVLHFGKEEYGPHRNAEHSVLPRKEPPKEGSGRWIQITTAQGSGKDAFVQPQEIPLDRRSETLLLVKRPVPTMGIWERRAYMGFDLSELRGKELKDAELSLTFAPTGFGFASLVPDATFQVFGLKDLYEDDWSESELKWDNAPACGEMLEPLELSRVELLGTFVIPQGEQSATVTVIDPRLSRFLNDDTNDYATLIVMRETAGLGTSDLVHGIASRRHPSLPPPTLRLRFD